MNELHHDVVCYRLDKIREPYVTGPCPFNQTLCIRIADEQNGDAISNCPLCGPYANGNKPHYQVPALADTNMALCLGAFDYDFRNECAWDGIWLEKKDLADIPISW